MRGTVLVSIALALAGCGGAGNPGGNTTSANADTSGGEAVPACSVPNSPAGDLYEQAGRAIAAEDLEGAVALYEQACEQGNPCACTERGEAQVTTASTRADVEAALTFLERGCEGGDNWGCHAAGYALWIWMPERASRARELFAQACENGVADSCGELGRFLVTGVTEAPAAPDAIALYDRSCENGARYACYLLGDAHAAGVGVPQDPDRARELLTWACDEAEVAQACTAWADLLDEDDETRRGILERGCERGDPFACDELDPESPRRGGDAPLATIATARPAAQAISDGDWSIEGAIGGDVRVSELGLRASCGGFVGVQPTVVLTVPEGALATSIRVHAPADTVLVVRDAAGRWTCADDGEGGSYDALVRLDDPDAGEVLVWAGALRAGTIEGARVTVSTDVPSPAVAIDTLTAPRAETLAVPTRAMTHYQLAASTVPGIAGVVRVDGQDLWQFGADGGMAMLDRVQCMLRPGRHTLEVAVLQRRGRARAPEGGRGMVHLELHGLEAPGATSETSRVFAIDHSVDAPARRQWQFTIGRRQGAAASEACTPAPAGAPTAAQAGAPAAPQPAAPQG